MTSRHQLTNVYSTPITPAPNTSGAAENMWCIQVIAPTAITKADTEPIAGHGLGSTRW
jgi:hypothetical protein